MSKELEKEYLADLDHFDEGMGIHSTSYQKCKERLIRLAEIESANPSEALECLDKLGAEKLSRGELIRNDDKVEPYINTIKQALLKVEKEHNSINLLMQELDCKDFADLKKYARCGYERLKEEKTSHEEYMEQFKEVSREEYDKFLRSRNTYTNFFMDWYDHYDLETDQILARNYWGKYYILKEDKSK